MCGILGWMTTKKSRFMGNDYIRGIHDLFLFSETRGKEASGVCGVTDKNIHVVKAPFRAKKLVSSEQYKKCLKEVSQSAEHLVMGHTRMVTNGNALDPGNNQPIVYGDLICIHNGIIVNDQELWSKYPELKRKEEVDTEVFLALMERYGYKEDVFGAFQGILQELEGSLSIALVDRKSNWLFLYTNVGSLYIAVTEDKSDMIFASEQFILEQILRKYKNCKGFIQHEIIKLLPGTGMMVNLVDGEICKINGIEYKGRFKQGNCDRKVLECSIRMDKIKMPIQSCMVDSERKEVENLIKIDIDKIHALKRCKKCLLPETFPGIKFDAGGGMQCMQGISKNKT